MPSATTTSTINSQTTESTNQAASIPTLPPISVPTSPLLNPPARFSTVCENVHRASTQSLILLSNSSSSSAKDRSARHSRAATTPTTNLHLNPQTPVDSNSSFNPYDNSQPYNNGSHTSNSSTSSLFNNSSPIISNPTSGGISSSRTLQPEETIPSDSSAPFLRTLKLKTILLLSPEHAPASLIRFCRKDDIHLVHVGLEGQVLDLPATNGQPQRMGVLNPSISTPTSSNGSTSGGILRSSAPFPTTMITERTVKDGLEMLLDTRTHPILVLDE